jgi:cytochrome c553
MDLKPAVKKPARPAAKIRAKLAAAPKSHRTAAAMLLLLGAAAAWHPQARADDAPPPAAGTASHVDADAAAQIAGQVCSNCHGPGGLSQSPLFPRLAGQQALYLAAQIRAFQSKTRSDPEAHSYMWGMATLISGPMVDALAQYYAGQAPAPGTPGNAALIAKGQKLFEQGVPERGIAACASCHGADAAGRSIFPRLAGQHAAYLTRQLEVIQKRLRDSPIMHGIVKDLKPDEMKAVAEYLQSK